MFYLIVAVLIASFYFFIAPKSVKHHESSLCHGYLSIAPTFGSAINH